MSVSGSASPASAMRTAAGSSSGRSPWTLITASYARGRVEPRDRLMDAVRAGRQLRIGQHRPPTGGHDRLGDFRVAAGDDDRPRFGRDRATPDMDDHRGSADRRRAACPEAASRPVAPE